MKLELLSAQTMTPQDRVEAREMEEESCESEGLGGANSRRDDEGI